MKKVLIYGVLFVAMAILYRHVGNVITATCWGVITGRFIRSLLDRFAPKEKATK